MKWKIRRFAHTVSSIRYVFITVSFIITWWSSQCERNVVSFISKIMVFLRVAYSLYILRFLDHCRLPSIWLYLRSLISVFVRFIFLILGWYNRSVGPIARIGNLGMGSRNATYWSLGTHEMTYVVNAKIWSSGWNLVAIWTIDRHFVLGANSVTGPRPERGSEAEGLWADSVEFERASGRQCAINIA